MKLKYYMRGLGIGICLTTLILSFGKDQISNEEIVQRAEKLGMKKTEETEDKLHNVLDEFDATKTPSPSIVLSPSAVPSPTLALSPTMAPSPTIMQSPTPEPTATSKPTKAPGKKIAFSIKGGMSSDSVASVLQEAGVIKNAKKFNEYIIKKGKASVIRVGNYSISEGASYDDIIRKITN